MKGQGNKQIIILGCQRSGTSMVAGIVYHLGVPMGEIEKEKSRKNPLGFFEDVRLQKVNTDLLKLLGRDIVSVMETDYKQIKRSPDVVNRVRAYIDKRNKESAIWGAKDPRMLPFWPIWANQLTHPEIIIVRRDWRDVVESVVEATSRRTPNAYGRFAAMVKRYEKIIEQISGTRNTITIEYDWGVEYPEECVRKIAEHIQVGHTGKQFKKAVEFIQPKRR